MLGIYWKYIIWASKWCISWPSFNKDLVDKIKVKDFPPSHMHQPNRAGDNSAKNISAFIEHSEIVIHLAVEYIFETFWLDKKLGISRTRISE